MFCWDTWIWDSVDVFAAKETCRSLQPSTTICILPPKAASVESWYRQHFHYFTIFLHDIPILQIARIVPLFWRESLTVTVSKDAPRIRSFGRRISTWQEQAEGSWGFADAPQNRFSCEANNATAMLESRGSVRILSTESESIGLECGWGPEDPPQTTTALWWTAVSSFWIGYGYYAAWVSGAKWPICSI